MNSPPKNKLPKPMSYKGCQSYIDHKADNIRRQSAGLRSTHSRSGELFRSENGIRRRITRLERGSPFLW